MLRTTDWDWHITIYLMAVCLSRTLTSWLVPAAKKCVGHEFPFTAHSASSSILSLDLLMLYSPLWSHKIILLIKKLTLEQTEIRQSSSLWNVLLYVFHSPEATEQKNMRKRMVLSGWQHLEGLESWLFFFFFFFLAMPPMWHAGTSPTKGQTCTPEWEQSFNHWTAREVWKLLL